MCLEEDMAKLDNPRWEAFACGRANGLSADAAYENAGYNQHTGNASRLSVNESVLRRVAEIQAMKSNAALLNRADVLRELAENVKLAKGLEQMSASNQALNLIGKELGMFVDRRLLNVRYLDDMSEEELLEFLGGEPEPEELGAAAGSPAVGHA